MIVPNPTILKNDYPTTDGKPMAETDLHRILMVALIQTLEAWYALEEMVYVSGNLLLFYERGNRRRHVSPDVFVVKGVAKRRRLNYLLWEEGRPPNVVIELTSSSTHHEDIKKKFRLYQDVLQVREYFLFDPFGDYLEPTLQGFRLHKGEYVPIKAVAGRLPSKELELHLEPQGDDLKLYNPATGLILPTPAQAATARADHAEAQAKKARKRAREAETELERLRRENEELRRRLTPES